MTGERRVATVDGVGLEVDGGAGLAVDAVLKSRLKAATGKCRPTRWIEDSR
jgi:hypothetical protein